MKALSDWQKVRVFMFTDKLDSQLRAITPSEEFYLSNPGSLSPRYQEMSEKVIDDNKVYCFEHPRVQQTGIEITRDSRFTCIPPHIHSNVNMNYIYSGKCVYWIDNKEVLLTEGDICIFDKDVVRSKEYIGENDIVISISLSNEFFTNNFLGRLTKQSIVSNFIISALSVNEEHDHYLIFKTRNNLKIRESFIHLLSEYVESDIYSKELINSYLAIIFVELLRVFQCHSEEQLVHLSHKEPNHVFDIIYYIEINYLTCTLTSLAENFNYHPKYLSHLIKTKTGKTFKEIQLQQRLKIASSYLFNSSLSVQEIAEKVGIYNKNFFYRKFKECYHQTPNEYRNMIVSSENRAE